MANHYKEQAKGICIFCPYFEGERWPEGKTGLLLLFTQLLGPSCEYNFFVSLFTIIFSAKIVYWAEGLLSI